MIGNIIMGFDPGGSTGYCVGMVDESVLGFTPKKCNVIAWDNRLPAIRALLGHYRPNICIVEDFVVYKDKAKSLVGKRIPSAVVIGIIETYLYELNLPAMHLLMASTISRTEIPTGHLKFIPKLVAEQKEHAMDAYKHVRHFVVAQRSAAAIKEAQKKAKLNLGGKKVL